MIETPYDQADMAINIDVPLRALLEEPLRAIVGDVVLHFRRNHLSYETEVKWACVRCPAIVTLRPFSTPVTDQLVELAQRRAGNYSDTFSGKVAAASDSTYLKLVAEAVAQEIADEACGCVRDTLATRGGPRPKRRAVDDTMTAVRAPKNDVIVVIGETFVDPNPLMKDMIAEARKEIDRIVLEEERRLFGAPLIIDRSKR